MVDPLTNGGDTQVQFDLIKIPMLLSIPTALQCCTQTTIDRDVL